MISKYFYSKVICAKTTFISLWLNPEEICFLEKHHIAFYKKGEFYQVNCDQLKTLFIN